MNSLIYFTDVSIPWYDMMMHTLGGIFLAVFAGAVFARYISKHSHYEIVATLLLIVLIVGLGWEFFEYGVQYIIKGSARLASIPDSISDMVCDFVGGVVGAYFVILQKKRYNETNE